MFLIHHDVLFISVLAVLFSVGLEWVLIYTTFPDVARFPAGGGPGGGAYEVVELLVFPLTASYVGGGNSEL